MADTTTIAIVKVIAGRDLASKDSNGFSDPYCYVNIGKPPHNKATRQKTKIIYKDLNPVWNETFEIEVTDIENSELYVEVWDYDKIGGHDFMGKVQLPMSLVDGRKLNNWFELASRGKKSDGEIKGSIHLQVELKKGATKPAFEPPSLKKGSSKIGIIRKSQTMAELPPVPVTPTYRERDRRFIDIVPEEVLNSLSSQERKRQEVIFEFVNTEDLFCNDVKIIVDIFLKGIRNESILESNAEVSALFSNIEEILTTTENFSCTLKELQAKNPVIKTLGETLLTQVDSLRTFITYCSNQKFASNLAEEYRTREIFAAFLVRNEAEEACRNLPFGAFIVKPLQRLCKYPLLLREILKETSDDDPDKAALEEAEKRIKEIVDEANEKTREVERLARLSELRKLLKPTSCSELMNNNEFEAEGQATFLLGGESKGSEGTFVLLPEYLIVFIRRKDAVKIITSTNLRYVEYSSVDDTDDSKNRVDFVITGGENLIVNFAKADTKSLWLSSLEKLQIRLFARFISDRTGVQNDVESLKLENEQLHSQIRSLSKARHAQNKFLSNRSSIKRADTPLPGDLILKEEKKLILIKGAKLSGKTSLSKSLISHFNSNGGCSSYFSEENFNSIQTVADSEEVLYRNCTVMITECIKAYSASNYACTTFIVDGCFPYLEQLDIYQQLADGLGFKFFVFLVQVPFEIRKQRGLNDSDAKVDAVVPDRAIIIDNSRDLKASVQDVLSEL